MIKHALIAAAAVIGLAAPADAGENPFLGEVLIFAGNYCPVNYAPADGRLLPIGPFAALFTVLGTTYGGDGFTNFALPHLKPIYTANRTTLMQCIAINGIYPTRP